jgi:arylsulfatase A-like enzyme
MLTIKKTKTPSLSLLWNSAMRNLLSTALLGILLTGAATAEQQRMNVLFIAVDDLNHWVGYTGRNLQGKTPNIDRLSKMGMSFTNAHCTAPACNPSRASLMSGMRPDSSGCYLNEDKWTKYIKEGIALNHHFRKSGYYTVAMGKIYHELSNKGYESGWDEYPKLPVSGRGPARKFEGYFEAMPHDMKDQDLGDWHTVDYCIKQLQKAHDKPFFIACGLIKPHLPWAVPRKYYDLFPLDQIELPPYLEGDLDDVPLAGKEMAHRFGDHAKFKELGRWKHGIQSYLATCAYTDMNIGRLLDAFDKSKYKDNTVIVLWGDHGWHLGEKEHWRKFSLWEEATRAPLIWVAPGVTKPDTLCGKPVDFVSIYPTLCELTGLPLPDHLEGPSLKPLLLDPNAQWDHAAKTTHGFGNHAVRTERWRYIRYNDGSEELYDHSKDQYEYNNLAQNPEYTDIKAQLAKRLPQTNRPFDPKRATTPKAKKKSF